MKKIFTTLAMAALSMTSFAQSSQQYYRVEFTVPVSLEGKKYSGSNTSVSATMKDDYTYCNPEHDYLDFQATNNPMWFDNATHNYSATSYFYLKMKRNTQGGDAVENANNFMCDKVKSITAYSIPVEKIVLLDSTTTHRIEKGSSEFVGDYPTTPGKAYYDAAEFTFNRLPRNVAELKTLLEDGNGNRVEACKNPLFIAAVAYLIWPRLLDCSQDCWDMWNYLYGRQYSALNTYGVANATFQNACISQFVGLDAAGYYSHNNAFQFFAGATPGNQYKPNGKGHGVNDGPYKVRVAWDVKDPLTYDSTSRCNVASILLFPNPDAKTKDEMSFEYPVGHPIKLRSTKNNGWFFRDGEKIYYAKGKAQYNDDF